MSEHGQLDLVLDVGKTHARLLVLDQDGEVLSQCSHDSATLSSGAWAALDTQGLAAWLEDALATRGGLRPRLASLCVSAHGAAFAAVEGDALAWPVPDYEWAGFDERPPGWDAEIGPFADTHSPDLPRGLNAATQFDWLSRHAPAQFERGTLLPYAQYWAWWFSGVAATEVSSLGCHTHLWSAARGGFSALARQRGWAARFAGMRRAWDVLGPVRPDLARRLGLPGSLRVHTGAHDSNACLARYLRSYPRMTLVTTGTWIVVMAPGAAARPLDPARDMLSNVSVRNERVPTGRFMGGRELQALCAGANPELANADDLARLLSRRLLVLPGFELQGGPFRGHCGALVDDAGAVPLDSLSESERATAAALYAAHVTAWIVEALGGIGPLVVEGPFAGNPIYTGALDAMLHGGVQISADPLEGTARGSWMLARWTQPTPILTPLRAAQPLAAEALRNLHRRWCEQVHHLEAVA